MKCSILIKTKTGFLSIDIGRDYRNDNVLNALSKYTGYSKDEFVCLSNSISYAIFGIKKHKPNFPIKRWLNGGAKDSDYSHTFKVKFIKSL